MAEQDTSHPRAENRHEELEESPVADPEAKDDAVDDPEAD
jgi:hypothetical protein